MKKYTSIILAALCILFIAGCSKNEHVVSDTPNTMVPSIIFEGNLYDVEHLWTYFFLFG